MRKIQLSITLIAISTGFPCSGCQSAQTRVAAAPEILAEFQIQGGMNHIILPVTFEGKEYPFVLDTGSTTTVFDKSFRDKLGKQFMWPTRGRGPEGRTFKVEWYRYDGPDPYVGPLKLEDTSLIRVHDLDQVVSGEKRDFQGIISMEFLAKYVVQIDFDNKKVTFFRGKKDSGLLPSLGSEENRHPEWGEPIPLKKRLLHNIRYVRGTVLDDTPVDFLVDTGWLSVDSLKSRIFDKIHSQQNSHRESGDAKSSSTGLSIYSIINQVENFSVGSFEYKNHVFRRSSESVLGLAFLQRHLVTLDFPNNVMYLKKGDSFGQHQQPAIVISFEGMGCELNTRGLVVTDVDPNGSAHRKGIREGYVLTKINGRNVSPLRSMVEITAFMSQLSAPTNGGRTFTFKHGDETITVAVGKRDADANQN
jgi:predicted aspartyl protease